MRSFKSWINNAFLKHPLLFAVVTGFILMWGIALPLTHLSKFLFGSVGSWINVIIFAVTVLVASALMITALDQDTKNFKKKHDKK